MDFIETHDPSSGKPNTETGKAVVKLGKKLSLYSIAVYGLMPDGKIKFAGSGFFIRYKNRIYFITAGHVIRNIIAANAGIRLGFGKLTKKIQFDKLVRTSDDPNFFNENLDIAIGLVADGSRHIEEVEQVAIPEELISADLSAVDYERLVVNGFPHSANKQAVRKSRGRISIKGKSYTYAYIQDEEFDLTDIFMSRSTHISIRWKPKDSQKKQIKHPLGLSGSAVWAVSDLEGDQSFRVVGLFIEYYPEHEICVATQIGFVYGLIEGLILN